MKEGPEMKMYFLRNMGMSFHASHRYVIVYQSENGLLGTLSSLGIDGGTLGETRGFLPARNLSNDDLK